MPGPINRHSLLGIAGGALLGARHIPASQSPPASEPPNIVFILADDLGWADLGCYGNPEIKTPALDRLAQEGTRFTQFYVNSAVCSPSRTAFLTGNYPARHRIHGALSTPETNRELGMPDALDAGAVMLPRLMQQAAYVTGHFGKWHLSSGRGAVGLDQYGFDEHRIGFATPGWEKSDPYFWARSTRMIVDEAIRFIQKHRDRRFFVNVWPFPSTCHPEPRWRRRAIRFESWTRAACITARRRHARMGPPFLSRRPISGQWFASGRHVESMNANDFRHGGVGDCTSVQDSARFWACSLWAVKSRAMNVAQTRKTKKSNVVSMSSCPVLLASEMSGSLRLLHCNHLGGG
jgi:hypothetical protein